jgi:hypothetical protein
VMFIPDPPPDFSPIPDLDPGSRGQKAPDLGSESATLTIAKFHACSSVIIYVYINIKKTLFGCLSCTIVSSLIIFSEGNAVYCTILTVRLGAYVFLFTVCS